MATKIPTSYHFLQRNPRSKSQGSVPLFPHLFLSKILLSLLVLWIAFMSFSVISYFLTHKNAGNESEQEHYITLAETFLKGNDREHAMEAIAIASDLGAKEAAVAPLITTLARTEQEYQQVNQKLRIWQAATQKNPGWRDAWLEVARYAYMLGNFPLSKSAVSRALVLDPNYPPALTLFETSPLASPLKPQ